MNYRNEDRTRSRWPGGPSLNMGCGVALPIVILAVVLGFVPFVLFYTDFVWYDALGCAAVFLEKVLASMAAFWLRFHTFPGYHQI